MRALVFVFVSLLALAAAACTPTPSVPDAAPPDPCTVGFLGDAGAPMVVEVIGLDPTMTPFPVANGDMVTLAFPPQGGRVIFAGVRATNLDGCGVQLEGVIRDEVSKQVRLDSRTVNLLPTGDGWGSSNPTDVSTFANVPVCPNEWSATNLYGTSYQLEVAVTDRAGRSATQTLDVTPECSEPAHAAVCLCICQGGYVLGEVCDGGASDPGDGGGEGDGGA